MRRHVQIRHRAAQNDLPQKYHKISRDGPVLELISQSANPVIICGGHKWHQILVQILGDHPQMWTRGPKHEASVGNAHKLGPQPEG